MLALGVGFPSAALAGDPPTDRPARPIPSPGVTSNIPPGAATTTDTPAPPAPAASSPAPTTEIASPSTGAPRDGAAAIAEARRAVEEQRYEDALALLAPHLASASRQTRAASLEVTAIVRLLVGRQAAGREAVAALYELAPGFLLDDPSLPPRVTRVFEAEAALPHGRSVTMAIRPADGERGLFEVAVTAPAAAIDLACSAASPPSFAPVKVNATSSGFRFRIPTLAAHRCYAIARDADSLPLGRLGSSARPLEVAPPPPPPPLVTRWWVWTAAAVAVAAVTAGVIAVTQQPRDPPAADITIRPQHVLLSW